MISRSSSPRHARAITSLAARPAMRPAAQAGGTFLGIILGVMVGLAAALGVAIYVAKVPVPFINKNTSRTSGQDAAEAERNRDWDPNAPLRNKNGAKPAPSGASATGVIPPPDPAPIAPPAVPAPAEVARPGGQRQTPVPAPAEVKPAEPRSAQSKPATTAADKASAAPAASARGAAPARAPTGDPLGDLATARANAAGAAQAAGGGAAAEPFTYFVQAGAFRAPEDAESQRARLSLMGVEARVTEREQAGRTVFRVRVGPFQNKDAADRVKERLDGNGFESALVRVQR